MIEKKRLNYIDILKGIGIILVILGHMEDLTSAEWKEFTASFHMPLFFFISGLLFNHTYSAKKDIIKYIKTKAYRLLIPYILWGLIYMNGISLEFIVRLLWANNKLYGAAGLWFLPTLFIAAIASNFLIDLYKKQKIYGYLATIICFVMSILMDIVADSTIIGKVGYPFSIDIALMASCFIFLGFKFRTYAEKATNKWLCFAICLTFFPIIYILSKFNLNYINDPAFNRVVMARGSYGNYIIFICTSILGSVACIYMSKLIEKNNILEFIGKNSLIFMCTNHLSINILNSILEIFNFEFSKMRVLGTIEIIIFLILSICICSLCTLIINKFAPILG